MGQLIVFYVPANFRSPQRKWMPEAERGKVIAFHAVEKKSA
ncbi:MAG TPA: hypothetical protein VFR84_15980 [Candidatus Angelobacter sp.]|nr:hypothetical protein [Candidatus Angelobacter sp.]